MCLACALLAGCADQTPSTSEQPDAQGDLHQGDLDAAWPDADPDSGPGDAALDGDAEDEPDADLSPDDGGDLADGQPDLAIDLGDADGDEETGGDPPLFDRVAIRDPATAACSFTDQRTTLSGATLVEAWNVSYRSWESIDGQLVPILIRGYAARRYGADGRLPGVVQAHGLGGKASLEQAAEIAALVDVMVISYSGPGSGNNAENTSEGRGPTYDNGYRLWDTLTDIRGSWFWSHSVAGMRAITCLQTRSDVDPDRIGMTGFSAGSIATLMVAAADDRLVAAVPMSGTGGMALAVESPSAWQHALLEQAELTVESEEWLEYIAHLDPVVLLPETTTAILLMNGSTDEFFPLTAHNATYGAIPGDARRTSIIGNYDHGCYGLTGIEDEEVIDERADLHKEGGLLLWFGHYLTADPDFSYVPLTPTVTVTAQGDLTAVAAQVDTGGSSLEVEEVRVFWSNDNSLLYFNQTLDEVGGGLYGALTPFPLRDNSIYFVDVVYRTDALLFPDRFAISSPPVIPDGLVPSIRAFGTCLPPE